MWDCYREEFCIQKEANIGKPYFASWFTVKSTYLVNFEKLSTWFKLLIWVGGLLWCAEIPPCLLDGVSQNGEDLSYMFDETTPIKACGDLAYHVADGGTSLLTPQLIEIIPAFLILVQFEGRCFWFEKNELQWTWPRNYSIAERLLLKGRDAECCSLTMRFWVPRFVMRRYHLSS